MHVKEAAEDLQGFFSGALALPFAGRGLPENPAEDSERGDALPVHRGGGHGGHVW